MAPNRGLFLFPKKIYSNAMEILRWQIDPELAQEAENNYRTNFAMSLKDRPPMDIIHELTFDGAAKNVTIAGIEDLFKFVESNFLDKKLGGVGLEVGAGPATFSSVLAKKNTVQKVYAVEICRPIVEALTPKVAGYILGDIKDKVIPVIGSFDQMELPDESVDFIFDFFSLHHSLNLEITLKECHRVLKKGGFIFCFDKARPDNYGQNDLDELLDQEYGEGYKKQFGLPLDQKITRRLNGEREYRLKDWITYFKNSGFTRVRHFYLAKTISKIKKWISYLPALLQLPLNKLLPKPKYNHKFIISSQDRIFTKLVNPFAKEISLLIAYK